jgi:hypothetical protein
MYVIFKYASGALYSVHKVPEPFFSHLFPSRALLKIFFRNTNILLAFIRLLL